ncbi:MAG: PAS domain S-box protein [Rhodothermales bacterium]
MKKIPELQLRLLLLCVLLALLIFAADLFVPLGVAGGVPYVAVVLLAVRLRESKYTVFFAIACTGLTLLGFFLSPPGGELWQVLANRALAGFAIWVTAILSLRQKKTRQALQESEARARTILDTSIDAIFTFDKQGHIASFNPAAEKIFGYREKEVRSRHVKNLVAPSYRERLDSLLFRDQAGNGAGLELIGQRKDNATFPMEVSVSSVQLNGQGLLTAIVRDITERRRLEQKVLRMSDQERRHIGQNLQEELGQMLTGIGLINQTLSRKLQAEHLPYAGEVMQITELIREADRYVKGLARGLSPVALDATGLSLALRHFADDTARLFKIDCSFEEEGAVLIHDNMAATHLYKIAQEAVSYAVKRGMASKVKIMLSSGAHMAQLRIEDDGRVPYDTLDEDQDDLGIQIMAYRAHLIGATLDVSDGLTGGFILTCTLPQPASEAVLS